MERNVSFSIENQPLMQREATPRKAPAQNPRRRKGSRKSERGKKKKRRRKKRKKRKKEREKKERRRRKRKENENPVTVPWQSWTQGEVLQEDFC